MNKRITSVFSLSCTPLSSMFSIPLFLRGWGRAISIVTHLGGLGILMVSNPGHCMRMCGYVSTRGSTWKRKI